MTPAAPARSYDASGRRATAARNRAAVLTACHDLLLRDGYQGTTIRAVAERAGVSPETIYKSFGSKQRLMKAVYDITVAGDDDPAPIGERPAIREIWATDDPREKVRLYAAFVIDFAERLGGLLAVLTEADPEVAEVRAATDNERLTGVGAFVRHLADGGHLASDHFAAAGLTGAGLTGGLGYDRAVDVCWALTSPTLYAQLTGARSWSRAAYEGWLADMLTASLLSR